MLKTTNSENIYSERLAASKIPALSGRASTNNKSILRSIALNGPMLKYGIAKHAKGGYPTVSRRIDDLAKAGYLAKAGKKTTERGKQTEESMFGLTWRGFVASLTIEEVRENTIEVLERNPLLSIPEKKLVLPLVQELMTKEEIRTIAKSLSEGLLETIPNLELLDDEQLLIATLSSISRSKLPKDFTLTKIPKEGWAILDKPAVLEFIKQFIVPYLRRTTEEIEQFYYVLRALNDLGSFISKLKIEDTPSQRIKQYLEKEMPKRFQARIEGDT